MTNQGINKKKKKAMIQMAEPIMSLGFIHENRKQETGNIYSSQRQQNRVFNTKTIQYITYMST